MDILIDNFRYVKLIKLKQGDGSSASKKLPAKRTAGRLCVCIARPSKLNHVMIGFRKADTRFIAEENSERFSGIDHRTMSI